VTVFLNFLTVKFLNSIWARSQLLLYWKELKKSVAICEVIEISLDKQPTSISLSMWKSKRWNSVPKQEVNPSAKCNEVQRMLDGSTCRKQSVFTRQLRYVCVSVSTAILTISNKKLPLGGNTAWSIQLLRSFKFHCMHNSLMSVCPSWPIIYKHRHMAGVSVEIRARDRSCQIFYCNFSGHYIRLYAIFHISSTQKTILYLAL
jgi:hypothetical protein